MKSLTKQEIRTYLKNFISNVDKYNVSEEYKKLADQYKGLSDDIIDEITLTATDLLDDSKNKINKQVEDGDISREEADCRINNLYNGLLSRIGE